MSFRRANERQTSEMNPADVEPTHLAMGRGANESADGLSRREVTRVARMVWCVQNDEREGA